MKTIINQTIKTRALGGLTAIMSLCIASVHAGNSPATEHLTSSSKTSHGGGSHGGGSGSGSFYSTASTVSQLIADINYANNVGGAIIINLAPGTTFDLVSGTSSDEYGANLLPIVGGSKAVNLTIIGNGATVQRDATTYQIRFFEVAAGSSLTLEQMTLTCGYSYAYNGGAIYNFGTLTISNCTLSGNTAHYSGYISTLLGGKGGAIYNNHGTVIIEDSILSGNLADGAFAYGGAIYNDSGTVTISNSTLSGNYAYSGLSGDFAQLAQGGAIYNAFNTLTISHSTVTGNLASYGGGIFNAGTTIVANSSSLTGNTIDDVENYGGALSVDGTSTIGAVDNVTP